MFKELKRVTMNVHMKNIQKYVDLLTQSSTTIVDRWLSNVDVIDVLKIHGIDKEYFKINYALNVFDYYISVIKEEEQIGNCPVMVKLLEFFQKQDISSAELYKVCIHFRESLIKESMYLGFFSEEIYDSIVYIFNKNFSGVLDAYSQTIHTAKQEVDEFYTLVDESLNEIYIFDKESLRFTYANKGGQDNIGYSIEQLKKMAPYDIKPEYEHDQFVKLLEPLINHKKKLLRFQTIHQRANGTRYNADIRLQLMYIGGQEKYIAFIHDITQEVQTRSMMQDFQSIIERSSNEVLIADKNSMVFIYANESAIKNSGYDESELYAMTPFDLHPDLTKDMLSDITNKSVTHGSTIFTTDIRRKNKSRYPIEMHIESKFAFGREVFIAFGNDISKRVRAVEEKELVEKLLEKIQSANEKIENQLQILDKYVISSTTDTHGVITAVSQAFCDISGYSKFELVGKHHNIVRHPEMPKSLYEKMWKTIQDGQIWQGEIKNLRKDGTSYWVKVTITPFYEEHTLVGYTAIRYDISDKKAIENYSKYIDTIIDSTSSHMAIVDANGKISRTNRAWRDFAKENGYSGEPAMIGKDYFLEGSTKMEKSSECQNDYESGILSVFLGEKKEFVHDYDCHSPHEKRWFNVRANRFNFDGKINLIVTHENITDLKQVQLQLEEQKSHLELLNRSYKALSDTNMVLSNAQNEQDLFSQVTKIIHRDCDFQLVWVGITQNNEDKSVKPIAFSGTDKGYIESLNIVYAKSDQDNEPIRKSIREKRVVVINDIQNDETFLPWKDMAMKNDFKSTASFPIKTVSKTYGALSVYSNEVDSFNDEKIDLLTQLSKNLAIGIESLRRREEFEVMIKTSRDGIAILDLQTNFLYFNEAYLKMTGFSKEELLTKSCIGLSDPNDIKKAKKLLEKVFKKGYVENFEKTCIVKGGKRVLVNMGITMMPDGQQLMISTKDITKVRLEEQQMRKYLSLIDEYIISSTTDLNGNINQVSQAFCQVSGYDKYELIGQNHRVLRDPEYDNEFFKQMWNTLSANQTWKSEIKNRKKNGSEFWVNAVLTPLYSQTGKKIGYTAIEEDITDKKRVEMLAITDSLTQIYNRRFFNEIAPRIVQSVQRDNNSVCLAILDVDHFKKYNDNYGHQDGDSALKKVAQSLKASLRRGDDYCFRLGGEEFGILIKVKNETEARGFVESVRENIELLQIKHEHNTPYNVLSVSIGCVCTNKIDDLDLIYKLADDYLYLAKENGRNKVIFNEVK